MQYNIQRPLVEMKKAFSDYKTGSPRTRQTHYFVIKIVIKDLFYLKYFFDSFKAISFDHISVLISHWKKRSLSSVTISSRVSILRKYLALINHDIGLPTNSELGLSRKKVTKKIESSLDATQLFETIKHPLTRLILKLQIYFGLTKEEASRFRIQLYQGGDNLLYVSKSVSYNNQDRLLHIYWPEQEIILKELADEISLKLSLAEKYNKAALMNLYHAELTLSGVSSKTSFRENYARSMFDYLVHQQLLSKDDAIAQIADEMGLSNSKKIKEWLSNE